MKQCKTLFSGVVSLFLGLTFINNQQAYAVVIGDVDAAQAKAELIAKLSANINKVDHAITVTKELIKNNPDANYLPELYFRLAELFVERSRYVYARIMEQQAEGAANLTGDKAIEVQISKRLAIETYTKIVTEYPDYPKNDQVLFFRAHEYRELGEWEKMLKELNDLKEKYPKSDWAIEARLILADYYFDKNDLPQAEKYYSEIVGLPESHLHDMARYKLGWIRINQEKYKEALKLFELAVSSKPKKKKGAVGDAHKLDVKREALLAMAWPYSEVRKAPQALKYFRGLASSKTLYVEGIRRLANRYFAKTEYLNAVILYREIVTLVNDPELNMEYVQRIDEAIRNLPRRDSRKYDHAAADVKAIIETVAAVQNHWKFADEEKGQILKDFELRARDLATRLHVESQRRQDIKSSEKAALAYRRYLSLYGDSKENRTIRLNRAEALFQAREFVDSGEQYEDVAKNMQDGPERRDLLYSAIVSFHNALEDDAIARGPAASSAALAGTSLKSSSTSSENVDKKNRKQLDSWQILRARQGMKQIGAYFVRAWPKDAKTPNVKFNVAKMHYLQGGYEKAAELFKTFVDEYPEHKDVVIAANLALDSINRLEKYTELAVLAKHFVDNPRIRDTKFKNEAMQLAEAAKRRNVEVTVLNASESDFSEQMLAQWEKHKGAKEGEDFLYAGFMKFMSEGNVAGVFDFGGRLLGAYPKSTRAPAVLNAMGAFALRAADFERAAVLYEEMYRRFPTNKNARSALNSAAGIRMRLGDIDKAAPHFLLLRRRGTLAERREASSQLLSIYRVSQSWAELATSAKEVLNDDRNWIVGAANLGIAYAEQGKDNEAIRELTQVAKMRASTDDEKDIQANAVYILARVLLRQFDALQFRDAASAEAILQQKIQLLNAAEQLYVQAVNFGRGEWAIASLQELARLYHGFGLTIAKLPLPGGLSAQDKKTYQDQINQQAQSYEAKAKEVIKACADKAEQLKVFTPHASACMAHSFDTVVTDAKRHRASSYGDEAYQGELNKLRQKLVKTPESVDVLKQLGRMAIQVGDYHLARLTLDKAIELAPRDAVALNLWGVAAWSLGEPQDAFANFTVAMRERSTAAAANLAALCHAYGFDRMSKRYLSAAGNLATANLKAPDYHPGVARMLQEGGGT
ncbi:MAG: tetratricopeptide repeat protein [Deltaproteobacteria bacterium]|nr:tetratricopeptide repeat protein [Deltaproteobacteria bacterium]